MWSIFKTWSSAGGRHNLVHLQFMELFSIERICRLEAKQGVSNFFETRLATFKTNEHARTPIFKHALTHTIISIKTFTINTHAHEHTKT